ncbi:hypothetical protein PVAP13_9KG247250 [Panicum virgatum]|uniref:Uncharacterized protein n=1 Tax=Panicum virgatum TaxID=38727 RepID=A0A8T0P0D7_PANVG|nr:hypothetical protein PVAP13_9KG247250 [Panicum virgatum]
MVRSKYWNALVMSLIVYVSQPRRVFMMSFMWCSSRSIGVILQQRQYHYLLSCMVVQFLHRPRSFVHALTVEPGNFLSNGLVVLFLKQLGSRWCNSRSTIRYSSSRTSCFERRAKVLWTPLLGARTSGTRRRRPRLQKCDFYLICNLFGLDLC